MANDSFIKAPDSSYEFSRVRTVKRVINGTEYHDLRGVNEYPEDILGFFYGHYGLGTFQQNAHAADAGFCYLVNPVGSGRTISLRHVACQSAPTSTSARPAIRLTVERFSFTGTPSGTIIPVGRSDVGVASPTSLFLSSSTGMTITPLGAIHRGFLVAAVPSGGASTGQALDVVWKAAGPESETVIQPGRGLLFRQADNSVAGEDRNFILNVSWLEY